MSRRGLRWLCGFALAALAIAPARADVHPNTAPGFPVEQAFHVGDVDSVNLFNGALTLTVPIGSSYPVNSFSYSLKLTYNSSPWEFKTVTRTVDNLPKDLIQAMPNRCSNAGLGWRISFGRINPPCQVLQDNMGPPDPPIYEDENGTDHIFYPTLHKDDAEDAPIIIAPSDIVSDIEYTRDGSYLRMKVHTDTNNSNRSVIYREIEYPDGSVRTFNTAGMPTEIRDQFSNKLMIDYNTPNQWILTDSLGLGAKRTHTIFFRTDLLPYAQTIDHIQLAVIGTSSPVTYATYTFLYAKPTIGVACPNNDTDTSDSVSVPLLTGVLLPDGSSWSTSASGYVTAIPAAAHGGCTFNGGNLTAWTLPTLGSLNWTWKTVFFPTGSTTKPALQTNPAVATRVMKNPDQSVQGTWTYAYSPTLPVGDEGIEHTTTITDSLQHRTVNYFSTAVRPLPDCSLCSQYNYSLPFSPLQPTVTGSGGTTLNLSRQTFDDSNPSSPVLLRSEYVAYERDAIFTTVVPDLYNINRRPVQSRTVYKDDCPASNCMYSEMISSNFDGLGHYRSQQTNGNFAAGNNLRSHFANYNAAQGTYTVDPSQMTGSGFTSFPSSSPWVLEAPSSMSDTEAGATSQVDLCYQPGTATVTRKRVHRADGATTTQQDLVTSYDISQGNVTAEKSYGGDVAASRVGTGDLCSLSLPAPEVEIDHTYASGVRVSSKYANTGFFFLKYPSVDPSSGLPLSSLDTAGLETDYEYDAFGRLLWSKPQGAGQGGWTQYVYSPASGSIPPNVLVRRRANGSKTAATLAVNQVVFDGFGRVFQELKTLPDGISSAKRQTAYDAVGNKQSVSEWTNGSPGNLTKYLNYDPFGRPGTIQPPDGASHDVTMIYHGVRQVDRKVKIATTTGSETTATTTEIYDRQGRLLSVTEPSGTGGANVTTTYGYDVGNRLASVSTPANVAGTQVIQTRRFNYDSAGLLKSEMHPEKGASGNGTVFYPRYDSRGHGLQKTDGPNNLDFAYDPAERLTTVKEDLAAGGRILKTFTYVDFNGTNDLSQGKLKQALRNNYVNVSGTVLTVPVTETYTYGGRDGRVSQRDTLATTGGSTSASFTQGFTYDDLGLVKTLSYPLCTHAGCTAAAVFADVPQGAPFQREIEALFHAGVTSGCSATPMDYCPNDNITRAQMAVFLLAAKEGPGYTPPACVQQVFADVPCANNPYAPWINELSRRGITAGCSTSPPMYCPNDNVTNAVMAVYVIASLGVSPPACSSAPFADVPCSASASQFIAEEARRQITTGCGGGNFCPNALVTRAQMAGLLVHTFDIPVATDPATQRSVQFAYAQGLLTSVSSGALTYGTLSYYPNLLVSQVVHRNGVIETQGNDPNEIRRPSSLAATGPFPGWSSGTYTYDGAGNTKAIGTASFTYDAVNRLVGSTQFDGPTGAGTPKQQGYTFDAFGNLTSITGTSGRNTPTDPQTNRLTGSSLTTYDAAGNLTGWNGATYQYDEFNQMVHMQSPPENWAYLYTADDERLWSYDLVRNLSHWTVRDLGAKVLRDYLNMGGTWSVATDYIYRDGLLLAAETQTGQRHFHLDHLGTPRLITRAGGEKVAYHVYYPFGEEATVYNQDTERMKFTGHERDLANPSIPGDDLDYMHARHESPVTGRFLSVDPLITDSARSSPQRWNRYSYVVNNPAKNVDPRGETLQLTGDTVKDLTDLRSTLAPEDRIFLRTKTDKNGKIIVDERLLSSRARSSRSGNLQRLSDVASSSKLVELTTSSPSYSMMGSGGSVITVSFGSSIPKLRGITLVDGGLSPESGATQIDVDPSSGAQSTAETVAHEMAHAWLFVQGKSPRHEFLPNSLVQDERGSVNRLTRSAADEAASNFDPFYPYQ
jgi:RHS repeat-associated protein